MTNDLQGAVAVISGAGRGLGAALAWTLADAGCRVVLCGRDPAGLAAVAEAILARTGRRPERVALDLADTASVAAAAETVAAAHPAVDVLINNGAAWLEARPGPYSAAEVSGAVGSMITGAFLLTQGLLPALRRSERPDIVTIGSVNGLPNAPLRTLSVPFYAGKHGQTALADGFRQVLAGTPVRSICVQPPYLDNIAPGGPEWEAAARRPKGARATTRDVVEAVLFALTRPRHVTLSSIVIDADAGGLFPAAGGAAAPP